jgi:Protein of unknown function (DUF3800)
VRWYCQDSSFDVQSVTGRGSNTAPLPRPAFRCGLSCVCANGWSVLYVAYLDEFGHIGPFVSKTDRRYNDSPVFGIGGFALPHTVTREFSGWFFRLRNHLLSFEIARAALPPSRWEKKGSSLMTTLNVERYPELTRSMKRIFNKIHSLGGFVTYVGFEKGRPSADQTSHRLYGGVLRRVLLRLDEECGRRNAEFLVVLDDNDRDFSRDTILKKAQQVMFGRDGCSRLIEVPLQVESVIYPNVQCADWICGLLGRYAAFAVRPVEFAEFAWSQRRFEALLRRVSTYSKIYTVAQRERTVRKATLRTTYGRRLRQHSGRGAFPGISGTAVLSPRAGRTADSPV